MTTEIQTQTQESDRLLYRGGYKYVTHERFTCLVHVGGLGLPGGVEHRVVANEWLTLRLLGDGWALLTVRAGYAWDGTTGPSVDTRSMMIPSLAHDALYQLIAEGLLKPADAWVAVADANFKRLYLKMVSRRGLRWYERLRARWSYWAVDHFGHARPEDARPVLSAP